MSTTPAPAGGPRSRRLARAIVAALCWAMVAVLAWCVWPTWLGGHTTLITVSGHSMEPALLPGDLVIAWTEDAHVGDVVIYRPEGYEDAKVVHRIIGGNGVDGWHMRGDNNDFTDPFTPTSDAVLGVAKLHIPHAGVVLAFLAQPWVWASLFVGMAALLLWPGRDDDDDDSPAADADADTGEAPDDLGRVEGAVLAGIVAAAGAARRLRALGPRVAMRGTALALAAVLSTAALVSAPEPASASGLSLTATGQAHSASTYCWPTGTALTAALAGTPTGGNYTQLKVNNLPAACAGKAMTVSAHSSTGAVLATAAGTAVTGAVTVTTASAFVGANVAYVVVTIGAPRVATVTALPRPPATCVPTTSGGTVIAGTCTVTIVRVDGPWSDAFPQSANVYFTATSSSGWFNVTFDFSQPPFPGWGPHSIGGNVTLPPLTSCSALPLVTVRGPSWSDSMPIDPYYLSISQAGGNICP